MMQEPIRAILTGVRNAWLATLLPDGAPHLTPIWIDVDGDDVVFSTTEETVKVRNLRRDPRVALAVESEEDRYRVVTLRGIVVSIEADPKGDLVERLSWRHDGHGWRGEDDAGSRVLVRVRPERVTLLED